MNNIFDQIPSIVPSTEPEARVRSNKIRHQKLSAAELRDGKSRLATLSEKAMSTLEEAMDHAEYPTAVSAAKIALDRSGFGPSSTININTDTIEEIPTERLLERGMELLGDSKEGQNLLQKLAALRASSTKDSEDSAKTSIH